MSDIQKEYNAYQNKGIDSINIFSYSFYFDVDAKFPGINLTIQTYHVHVYKDRFVFLNGENGN